MKKFLIITKHSLIQATLEELQSKTLLLRKRGIEYSVTEMGV